jgi:alcohol dehydrogenase
MKEPQNIARRGEMMLASLEAGLAFSNASLGAVHAMAHSLGGLLDAPHGECNAILLPYVIEFNFPAVPERYTEIARAMGLETGGKAPETVLSALVTAIRRMTDKARLSYTLTEVGVDRSIIPALAETAMHDPCIFTNPRQPRRQDIEAIYEKAL